MLCQSLWQVHEFAEHLKVSEIMTTENFQEAAALLQEGLVPVELVQATHDAVESALQRIHRLIYPNSQTVVPPHEIQQSSVQVAEDPQESPQVEEGGESEMEVLNGPDPSRALRDPSEEEKAPEYELSQVEVEELMQAEVTGENMEMQIRVMRRILNNQIPTPKCLTQEVAKPKLPKKAIRSRGRLLLIKASMMKGKGLKGKKNKDNKVKDGSKKKDNKVKDGAKKKHKKVEEGNKEKDKPEEGNKEKDTNVEEGNQKKVKKALKKGNRKNGKTSKSSKDPPVVPRAKVAAKAKAKIAPKAKAAARAAAVDADEKKVLAKKLHAATWRGNLKLQYWLPTWQDFQLLFIASIRYCHHNGSHIAILFVLCNAVSCVSFFFFLQVYSTAWKAARSDGLEGKDIWAHAVAARKEWLGPLFPQIRFQFEKHEFRVQPIATVCQPCCEQIDFRWIIANGYSDSPLVNKSFLKWAQRAHWS